MIRLSDIPASLDTDDGRLLSLALAKSGIPREAVTAFRLVRRSVDARDKSRVHFVCTVDLSVDGDEARIARCSRWSRTSVEAPPPSLSFEGHARHGEGRPVVVGAGPAGLFAALALAEAGARPLVVERGQPVERRVKDVETFFATGALVPSSNIQFGEGGAGTFSDGKLNTGIRRDAFTGRVLQDFVKAGAPGKILWEARPHVGTDLLRGVVTGLRGRIQAMGGEFVFGHRMAGIASRGGALSSLTLEDVSTGGRSTLDASACFLCPGHSARDTFEELLSAGIPLEAKPLSIGVRIEHPQRLVNASQYGGRFAFHPALGAADYRLAVHLPCGRGVYTFCMCPGGYVVAAASEEGGVVTNGMSCFARDGANANSALLVGITPEDFGGSGPLAGIGFQRRYERLAFQAGGGDYVAPATRVGDFLKGRPSKALDGVQATYRPGVLPGDVSEALPPFARDALLQAIPLLDKKLKGFAHPDAVMTAVETRSSSPVRILRGEDFQSIGMKGLYPCGEGAGYAGGITSSAADGLKAAAAFLGVAPV